MLTDVLAVLGAVLIAAGVGLLSIPAGIITAGVLLIVLAWRVDER